MVTVTQIHEYWRGLEASGFVTEMSAAEDLAASSCRTHKEMQNATKAQKAQVKFGSIWGGSLAIPNANSDYEG